MRIRAVAANPRDEMPAAQLNVNSYHRAVDGVTVTAREQATDERIVLHRTGSDALRQVCDVLDEREGDWRVLTISTPTTIYRDLQGTRYRAWGDSTQCPEPHMLGIIGRKDLLDPFHDPALPRGKSHA